MDSPQQQPAPQPAEDAAATPSGRRRAGGIAVNAVKLVMLAGLVWVALTVGIAIFSVLSEEQAGDQPIDELAPSPHRGRAVHRARIAPS